MGNTFPSKVQLAGLHLGDNFKNNTPLTQHSLAQSLVHIYYKHGWYILVMVDVLMHGEKAHSRQSKYQTTTPNTSDALLISTKFDESRCKEF